MRVFTLLLVLLSHMVLAQKSKTQLKVADDLAARLSGINFKTSPVRLAIVPFTASAASNDASLPVDKQRNAFGEYLTELVIGKVSENAQFKLFERSRLDAIFKENELMLSGMMKPSEAIRIGELLPIDMLFSGTYTKLKSYVDVSGRLIDVASGEIVTTYSGRVKMTKNIKSLFEGNSTAGVNMDGNTEPGPNSTTINVVTTSGAATLSVEEACRIKVNEFKLLLTDFSTQEKIDAIANEAMKTPFDNQCGQLHYELMYAFTRYKVDHAPYRAFLLNTLGKIPLPSQDDRSHAIIEYLIKDHDLSASDWTIVLNTIERSEYGLYSYLSLVFKNTDIRTGKARIDEYFQEVKSKKLGLPQPVTYDHAFYQLMQGLSKNQELMLYTYERYGNQLGEEPIHSTSNHMLYLGRMYKAETDPETKTKILRWVASYFQKFENEKSPEKLYDFAYQYRLRENTNGNKAIELQNEETQKVFPERDLLLLINLCKDKFTQYATQTQYTSQLEDRIDFCVKYAIPVPGAIPTMAEADKILKGNDLKEQERIMKLLIQMGDQPKPLENTLISLFDKRSLEDKDQLITVQSYAIQVLGNIKTSNIKAINYMVSKLMSYNYKENDSAEEALTKIGKPAIPPLINQLKATTIHDGGLRYKLIVLLGKNGKDAKAAEPLLLKIQKESTNKDILYAIEAALQEIRG